MQLAAQVITWKYTGNQVKALKVRTRGKQPGSEKRYDIWMVKVQHDQNFLSECFQVSGCADFGSLHSNS